MYIFASIGLITEPCAEPSSVGSNFPCSIIPALRYLRISHNKFLSCIFHSDKDMTNLSKKYDQMNNNLDILDSQDFSLKKQLKKDAAAFREEKFHPDPEQYTELLDTRIQIRPDFRDKLIEQLKGTFDKYYDYHRRDIAANEVDYLNVEDPDVFSHRAWELEYQREQEIRRNQPARTKKKSYDIEL